MKRFSSYAFWVALSGAVVVFLEDISNCFGWSINVSVIESAILSFCGVLVVLGIVNKNDLTKPNNDNRDEQVNEENIDDCLIKNEEQINDIANTEIFDNDCKDNNLNNE